MFKVTLFPHHHHQHIYYISLIEAPDFDLIGACRGERAFALYDAMESFQAQRPHGTPTELGSGLHARVQQY